MNICLSRNGLIPISTIDLIDETRSLNLIRSHFDTLIRSGFSLSKSIDLTYFSHMSPKPIWMAQIYQFVHNLFLFTSSTS